MKRRNGQCKMCGECCRCIAFDTGMKQPDHEWIKARRLQIGYHNGCVVLFIPHVCPHLTENNRCRLHHHQKPLSCKRYPESGGIITPGCKYYEVTT